MILKPISFNWCQMFLIFNEKHNPIFFLVPIRLQKNSLHIFLSHWFYLLVKSYLGVNDINKWSHLFTFDQSKVRFTFPTWKKKIKLIITPTLISTLSSTINLARKDFRYFTFIDFKGETKMTKTEGYWGKIQGFI